MRRNKNKIVVPTDDDAQSDEEQGLDAEDEDSGRGE